jgi:hypothetical protein
MNPPFALSFALRRVQHSPPFGFGCAEIAGTALAEENLFGRD